VTVEEHTIVGGLGGAVAETLGEHRPTPMRRIGFEDIYTESAPNDVLLDLYGLSARRVAERVREITWES
jgi:transketolase